MYKNALTGFNLSLNTSTCFLSGPLICRSTEQMMSKWTESAMEIFEDTDSLLKDT